MDLTGPANARPAYYDRTPARTLITYDAAAVAPHSSTIRASYTVPTAKKAYIEAVQLTLMLNVAATTAGLREADAFLVWSGFGGDNILSALLPAMFNTVAQRDDKILGGTSMMLAGDVLRLYTGDTSTGGSVDYHERAKVTEFDT